MCDPFFREGGGGGGGLSNHRDTWMVHAGCVLFDFVFLGVFCVCLLLLLSAFYPSTTCMSASFEFVRWTACVHRLDHAL